MKHEFGDCTRRLSLCLPASKAAGGLRRSTSCERTCARREPNVGVRGQFLGSHTPCTDRSLGAVQRAHDAHRRPRARTWRKRITNHPSTILRPPRGRRIGLAASSSTHATPLGSLARSRRARARTAPHARPPRRASTAQCINHLHHDYRSIVHTHVPLFVFVFYVAARKGGSVRARRRDAIDGVGARAGIRTFGVFIPRPRAPIYVHSTTSSPSCVRMQSSHTHTHAHAHRTFVSCTTHMSPWMTDDRRPTTDDDRRPTTQAPVPRPGGGDRTRRRYQRHHGWYVVVVVVVDRRDVDIVRCACIASG